MPLRATRYQKISIHALRGEGDLISKHLYICVARISIHALRGEGDDNRDKDRERRQNFNPRPPWGGRQCRQCDNRDKDRISIHALRGEGDGVDRIEDAGSNISIHALRGEGDIRGQGRRKPLVNFNPRPPWGGRLKIYYKDSSSNNISIHALRGEGDFDIGDDHIHLWDISIHALRGEGDLT